MLCSSEITHLLPLSGLAGRTPRYFPPHLKAAFFNGSSPQREQLTTARVTEILFLTHRFTCDEHFNNSYTKHTYRRPGRTGTGGKTAAACTAPRGPGGLGGRTAAPSGWRTRRGRSHSPGSFQLPGPGGAGLRSGTVISCAGHVNTPITTVTTAAAATRTNRPRRGCTVPCSAC